MTIIEGNVLIIEYMGGTREVWRTTSKVTGKHEELVWQNCKLEEVNGCSVGFPNNSSPEGFHVLEQYIHKDWNQLIAVCQQLHYDIVLVRQRQIDNQKEFDIWNEAVRREGHLLKSTTTWKITHVWEAVINGIQFINKLKNEQHK